VTTYRAELEQAAEELRSTTDTADVRGQGEALFLFAVRQGRSLELARSKDGVWIEFWNGEDPVHEETYSVLPDAAEAAREWLTRHPASE
jgi:hypothetical protein